MLEVNRRQAQPLRTVYRPERIGPSGEPKGEEAGPLTDLGLMPRSFGPSRPLTRSLDAEQASQILGGSNRPARLVPIGGTPGGPAHITIHGMNGAPNDLREVADAAARQGQEVSTLVYDDRFRRLTDNSRDLARQLSDWMQQNPGRPLRLSAHSMGARITLGALAELQEQGRLEGREIRLDMIAPPLGGFAAADLSHLDLTGAVGSLVPRVRPGYDMGQTSGFQERLEGLRLPPNVRTRIFLGGRDQVVDPHLPGFQRIRDGLQAQVVTLPEAAHGNVPAYVARSGY